MKTIKQILGETYLGKTIYNISWVIMKKIYNLSSDKTKLNINLGSGRWLRKGWKNLDYSSNQYNSVFQDYADYNHNLMTFYPLPFKDNSVDLFYSSHTIEHLPDEYVLHLFKEIYRCLKPNGTVRITCPDYDKLYTMLISGNVYPSLQKAYPDKDAWELFINTAVTHLNGKISKDRLLQLCNKYTSEPLIKYLYRNIDPNQQINNESKHISWWNYRKITKFLYKAGFKHSVYKTLPNQSMVKEFHDDRYTLFNMGFDAVHKDYSLYIEVIKQ